jgi:LuxR family maltose regulon positive regulatory protein
MAKLHVADPTARAAPEESLPLTLLAAKLAPPDLAQGTVARPRLTGLLSRAVQRSPLTLLSGPAGSGKTVLAASWCRAAGAGKAVGWLTLDDYDDDPATFWAYVVEALSRAGVEFSSPPRLLPGEPPPSGLVHRLAADVAARSRPVVLVIDNADTLTDAAVLSGLDLLVRNAGSRLRLVLAARADPLLPLHQYRLAGSMTEIRTDQLAFTGDEARDLLHAMGVRVTTEVAAELARETQGWAVGIRLAAAPLKQGVAPEHLVTSLAHDDGSVAQYLFAEVLERQPSGVRRLLLRLSVTAELWPDLVDRLSGRANARRALAGLARANAFVEEAPGAPGGFRIHPLFREMLQAQLAYEHPGEVAELHRQCADWYARAGRAAEAVGHGIAAEDWAFVTRLLVDDLLVARLLAHGSDPALRGLQALPADLTGPEASVIRTAVALAAGRLPAEPDVAAVAAARGVDHRPSLRASAALTHLVAGQRRGHEPRAVLADADDAAELVAQLPAGDRRELRECAAVLESVRALTALRTDAPTAELLVGLRAAAAAARAADCRRLRARLVAHLALLEALDGHLNRAAHLAEEAETLAAEETGEDAEHEPAAAVAWAWIHLRRYALVEAREWLTRERARRKAAAGPGADALAAVLQSQLLRLRHEYDAAGQCLEASLQGPRLPRWTAEQVVTEVVRLAVARGHLEEGLAILQDTSDDEQWTRRLRAVVAAESGQPDPLGSDEVHAAPSLAAVVESAVVRACQLVAAGNPTAAAEQLAEALELARPEVLRLPFLDTPMPVRRLLRAHPRLQEPGAWLNPSATAPRPAGDVARRPEPQVVQELSERELEVLRHLAGMLSTAEIAATMFISVNTVRTHIRSILRKLGVSRRNQAVRRARERGIL